MEPAFKDGISMASDSQEVELVNEPILWYGCLDQITISVGLQPQTL